MPARRFVCSSCGEEMVLAAAFAEGEVPVCCSADMDELVAEQGSARASPDGREDPEDAAVVVAALPVSEVRCPSGRALCGR